MFGGLSERRNGDEIDGLENLVDGTGIACDVSAGLSTRFPKQCLVFLKLLKQSLVLVGRMYLKAGALLEQGLSLSEIAVVGSDDDGNTIDCGFRDVVNAYTKAAADVGQFAVAIKR